MDIETLVLKSKKGDISAFMKLLKKKENLFYKIAFTYTKNRYNAEDCISEASIKAFDNINRLKKADKFYSWFISIIINTCRQQFRKNINVLSQEDIKEVKSMFSYKSIEDKIIIENLLEKLKKDEREILVLRYLKDYPIKEVAAIMDMPINTIKTKIYRSLSYLRNKSRGLKNEYREY